MIMRNRETDIVSTPAGPPDIQVQRTGSDVSLAPTTLQLPRNRSEVRWTFRDVQPSGFVFRNAQGDSLDIMPTRVDSVYSALLGDYLPDMGDSIDYVITVEREGQLYQVSGKVTRSAHRQNESSS